MSGTRFQFSLGTLLLLVLFVGTLGYVDYLNRVYTALEKERSALNVRLGYADDEYGAHLAYFSWDESKQLFRYYIPNPHQAQLSYELTYVSELKNSGPKYQKTYSTVLKGRGTLGVQLIHRFVENQPGSCVCVLFVNGERKVIPNDVDMYREKRCLPESMHLRDKAVYEIYTGEDRTAGIRPISLPYGFRLCLQLMDPPAQNAGTGAP